MKENYKRLRRGRKVYYINLPRLILSCTLILAVLVSGGIFAAKGIRTIAREAAFRQRFSALYMEQLPDRGAPITRCIVISPGHGGDDPGACAADVEEKDVNLAIALLLRDILQEKGYTVLMTRTRDMEADNTTAIAEANESGVDMLVAIHQNAADDPTACGIETWFEQGHIESGILAEMMQSHVVSNTGGADRGVKSDQSFELTRETQMPSVLIETGFLTNEAERGNLTDENYQMRIAQGIADGIDAYFAQDGLADSTFTLE